MTYASLLAIVAGLLVRFAFYSELFGGGRRSNNDGNAALLIPLIMLVSAVVYAISFLLIRLLSRYRELAADRSGALLTGQPSALASALQKVSGGMTQIPTQDLRSAEPLNAFYFAPAMNACNAQVPRRTSSPRTRRLEKRIEQLAKIQRELGQVGAGHRAAPVMGFLDTLFGRTKPVQPKLDDLFALPVGGDPAPGGDRVHARPAPARSASAPWRARPFADIQKDVRELLDMDAGKPGEAGLPVEVTKDNYGYTWLVSNHMSDEMDALVTDLHAVNSALVDNGFGPQLLCTLVAFRDDEPPPSRARLPVQARHVLPVRPAARPSGPARQRAGTRRSRACWRTTCKIEQDLARWFPVWGAPGL